MKKAATASSHHHLPCPIRPELEKNGAALVAANVRICQLETAAPQSSHHMPRPIKPELENARAGLVAANARNGELEKKVAKEPTTRVSCHPSAPAQLTLPPPELKMTRGRSAALVAANEGIVKLEKQLAGAIAKTTNRDGTRALFLPPVQSLMMQTLNILHRLQQQLQRFLCFQKKQRIRSKKLLLDLVLCQQQSFRNIKRANLLSRIGKLKQQVTAIDTLKPRSASSSPPDDPPTASSSTAHCDTAIVLSSLRLPTASMANLFLRSFHHVGGQCGWLRTKRLRLKYLVRWSSGELG